MASFGQQLLTQAIASSRAEQNRQRLKLETLETNKLNLLADPAKIDKIVSSFTTLVSPSRAKLGTDFASKVEAADANIPDDHPLKGYAQDLRERLASTLSDPQFRGVSAERMVIGLSRSMMEGAPEGEKNLLEKSHDYKYKKDYALSNYAGIFGEDETVKGLPGYEEFKDRKSAITPEEISTTYKEALGFGGSFAAGGQLGRRAAIKWGGKKLVGWGAKRLVTGAALGPHVALAAVAAVPAFKVFDATANIIERSHFGKSQGAVSKLGVEMIIGGLIPAYAGHKVLTKIISKAAQSGLIKGAAEQALIRLPTAKHAIDVGKAKADTLAKEAAAAVAIEKEGAKKVTKKAVFKVSDDVYNERRAGLEGLSKFEKSEIERDLAAPFSSEFSGVKTARPKSLSSTFANLSAEQSDAALSKAKNVGIREATKQVKEGADVVEIQRLKEIRDGLNTALKDVDEFLTPKNKYTVDDLVKNLPTAKKTRLVKTSAAKVKKTQKVTKEINDAVNKEVLAAKIAEVTQDLTDARIRVIEMNKAFRQGGIVQRADGTTALVKGGKKQIAQVPDDIVKKKEADIAQVETGVPEGAEELSYTEVKRRLLADRAAKQKPVKEEVVIKPAIENAQTSIGKQVEKQQGRKLTEAEMSDAEWLARAGESETIEDIFASTDALTRKEFDPSKWKFFVAAGVTVPLLSLYEPGEVEAAGISVEGLKVLAKSKVPKLAVDSYSAVAKSVKQLRNEMLKGNRVYIPAAEGQKFFGERMQAVSVNEMIAETGETLADQIIRSKSLPFQFDRAMSVGGFTRLYMKAGGDAGVELGSRKLTSDSMTEKGLQVADNIFSSVTNYDPNPKDIIEVMKPLADKFAGQVGAYSAVEFKIKTLRGARNKIAAELKRGKLKPDEKVEQLENLAEANKSLSLLKEAEKELGPVAKQFEAKYEATTKLLAKDNVAVRLSLAVEDTAKFKHRPWLEDMMTYEEKEAVGYYKKFMEEYAEEIARVYGKDAIIASRPYIHHAFHPTWKTKFINDELKRLKLGIEPHPPYTDLHSRSRYSKQMVPHIGYNTGKYIPDIEKRIQMQEFWKFGKRDGWDAVRRSPMVQGSDALRGFFQRVHNASIPASDHWSNKAANWYTSIEVLRLLGLSTSVAFKHLFKIPGTWAQLGFVPAAKHIPETFQVFARTFSQRDGGRAIAKNLNLSGKAGEKAVTDLISRTFGRQYGYMNTIMDMDMSVNVNSTFEKGLQYLNEKGGVLVRGVEHFDRAHGILAATHMAANRGMTATQATYGVVDTILKNNFLSGVLNPSWMHSPKVRALFLFQNTAFKIAERRIVGAIKTLELSKKAGKSIKAKGLRKTLKELRGMKQYVKEGEHEFKESIILDALNADRGFFGTPQSVQFMKEILIMGAIITGGGLAGVDLWEHANHIPFLKGHTKYPVLATSPIFNAIFDVKGNRAAAAKASKAPEFMMTDFLKEWLWQGKYGPYPQAIKKGMRLSNNDIPKRYNKSWSKYLFGIPATE